jgi:NADH-quinone oxidoreductase subunit K
MLLAASTSGADLANASAWAVYAVGAAISVVGAFGVVLLRNPVHCALSLVSTIFGIALLFIDESADFLAAVQIIVYGGAIVILFLFVIMLLGVDRREPRKQDKMRGLTPVAIVVSLERAGRERAETWPEHFHGLSAPLRNDGCIARHRRGGGRGLGASRRPKRPGNPAQARCPPPRSTGKPPTRDARAMTVPGPWYLVLAAVLFSVGATGLLVRRNILVMYMCIELMLNSVNLTFVTFARMLNDIGGQDAVFFVLVVAAAEVVVGLGIIVAIYRRRSGATADDISSLKG